MSLRHKTHAEYNVEVAPRLFQFIEQQRDRVFEEVLGEAFMLFAWVFEDFEAKSTKNTALFRKVGILLVETLDGLRSVRGAHASLSIVTLASLARIILEVRWNLKLVFRAPDPARMADLFARYSDFETLLHDERKPVGAKLLSPAKRAAILKRCPEWVTTSRKGKVQYIKNWTADPTLDQVAQRASAAGCADEYDSIYAVTSKYLHGSGLLVNAYSGPNGHVGAIAQPAQCKQMAALASKWAIDTLMEAAQFFGVPFPKETHVEWQDRWLRAAFGQAAYDEALRAAVAELGPTKVDEGGGAI